MRLKPSWQFKTYILITIAIFAIIAVAVVLVNSKKSNFDTTSKAAETATSWKFAIVTDTHLHSDDETGYEVYDKIFPLIGGEDPKILFHVGDLGWGYHHDYINWGDYRYQPLKGILSIQYKNYDGQTNKNTLTEVHVASGNHDMETYQNSIVPNKLEVFKDYYYNDLCTGEHPYWGADIDDPSLHFKTEAGASSPSLKDGFAPFNSEITQNGFCSANSTNHKYSFVRGNINFVVADFALCENISCSLNDAPSVAELNWLNDKICNTSAGVSILFIHDSDECLQKRIVDSISCKSKLAVIISGDSHIYSNTVYGGVRLVTLSGVAREEYDYMTGEVSENSVVLTRHYFTRTNPALQTMPIMEISGNFTGYIQASIRDTSEQSVTIPSGTSLLAFPVSPNAITASHLKTMLSDAGSQLQYLATYTSGSWRTYKKVGENYVGDDFVIETGRAYFVRTDKAATLKFSLDSSSYDPKFSLQSNWNLVSFHQDYGDDKAITWTHNINGTPKASQVLQLMQTDSIPAEAIVRYKGGSYSVLIYKEGSFYGEDFDVEESRGYFVKVDNTSIIDWKL